MTFSQLTLRTGRFCHPPSVSFTLMLFFPHRCALCDRVGKPVCGTCVDRLEPPSSARVPENVETFVGLVDYSGAGRELVTSLKYRNRRGVAGWAARCLASALDVPIHCVLWLPSSSAGYRQRGYDPAYCVAKPLARAIGARIIHGLSRSPDAAQHRRSLSERRLGPALTLSAYACNRVADQTILLVDDVCTTGASLANAAWLLRQAGAEAVHAAVLATTPRARGPGPMLISAARGSVVASRCQSQAKRPT